MKDICKSICTDLKFAGCIIAAGAILLSIWTLGKVVLPFLVWAGLTALLGCVLYAATQFISDWIHE